MPPTTLYRLAGLAGMLSGLLLLFNTARRGGVVPANALTHGTTLLLTAVVLLLGVLAFGVAMWRARMLPAPAILLYVVGLVPVALRGVLPEPAVAVGLILAAVGTAWLSAALWRTASRDANAPVTPRSAVP